jgi:hypothetical protein
VTTAPFSRCYPAVQTQKEQTIVDAAQAAASHNDYLAVIESVHHDCSPELNWAAMKREKALSLPPPALSMGRLPKLLWTATGDKLFKRSPKKVEQLTQAVVNARQRDQQVTVERQTDHAQQHAEWQDRQELSAQVLVKNAEADPQIMEAFAPCEEIGHLGSSLEFTFTVEHIEVERLSYLKTSDNCLEKD